MTLDAPLVASKKEGFVFGAIIALIFCFSLWLEYLSYSTLKSHNLATIHAKLINQYAKTTKNGKEYFVLKFKTESGFSFVTTRYEQLKDLRDRDFELLIKTEKLDFLGYLKGAYLPTLKMKLLPNESSFIHIKEKIKAQHEHTLLAELYSALFLATSMPKELRDTVNAWGIAHLVAISGFHAGVISAFIFGLFYYPYFWLQSRYFPYRNRFYDLSLISLFTVFIYLWFIDFVPSFLRSFVMMGVGFFLLTRNIKVLNFGTLALAVILILALFPRTVFSLGFWFSVAGVFYIFLYLKYAKFRSKIAIAIGLNIWVFVAMMPLVHYFFPISSLYQLYSPLMSIVFSIFYPTTLILHLFGLGAILDPFLEWLLFREISISTIFAPLWLLVLVFIASLASMLSRFAFLSLNILIFGFFTVTIFINLQIQ